MKAPLNKQQPKQEYAAYVNRKETPLTTCSKCKIKLGSEKAYFVLTIAVHDEKITNAILFSAENSLICRDCQVVIVNYDEIKEALLHEASSFFDTFDLVVFHIWSDFTVEQKKTWKNDVNNQNESNLKQYPICIITSQEIIGQSNI